MRIANADFGYDDNNGTLVVFPLETGRLADMVRKTSDGLPKVWVFRDIQTSTKEDGFDYLTRGLRVGTFSDGKNFIADAEKLGFTVQYTGIFVPLSNGKRQSYYMGHPAGTGVFHNYPEMEIRMVRIDLPTEETLKSRLK